VKDRCDRLFHYQYDLGYRATDVAGPLRFGTLLHAGLEVWWSAMKVIAEQHQDREIGQPVSWGMDPLNALRMAIQGMRASDPGRECDPFDLVRAEELMRGYHVRWCDQRYTIIYVEKQFRIRHINPETGGQSQTWDLAGVIDAGVLDEHGRHLVVEHKTSSQDIGPGSTYWQGLGLDPQISCYWLGGSVVSELPVQGVIYDVLKKPALRPFRETPEESKKYKCNKRCKNKCVGHRDGELYAGQHERDETPEQFRLRLKDDIRDKVDEYFVRGEIQRTEGELNEFQEMAWQTGLQIQHNRAKGTFPMSPGACERYRKMCEFFPVCTKQATLEDPLLYQKLENPDRELKQEDS